MTPFAQSTPARRASAPTVLMVAMWLMWLVVALLVLRAVLTYALFDSLVDSYVESKGATAVPREVLEDGAPAYRPIALGSALLFGGGVALTAVFLSRGAGWARILATIFGVLALLGGLVGLVQPAPVAFKATAMIVAVAAVIAVVLLWLPAPAAFFRQRRATG